MDGQVKLDMYCFSIVGESLNPEDYQSYKASFWSEAHIKYQLFIIIIFTVTLTEEQGR